MTTFFNDQDISGMFAGVGGVAVMFDSVDDQQGLVEYVDSVTLKSMGISGVINKAITVMLQTSQFPSLGTSNGVGKPITVDGVTYTVRERIQTTDGAVSHLLCTS